MISGHWARTRPRPRPKLGLLALALAMPILSSCALGDTTTSTDASAPDTPRVSTSTTSTIPPTTTTTVVDDVLWQATHEGGNLDEWTFISISGPDSATATITTSPTRSGDHAAALTISGDDGDAGVRLTVHDPLAGADLRAWDNLPREAFYSVWYFIPQRIEPYTNVFQWKQAFQTDADAQTRRLLYFIRAEWSDSLGAMRFHLRTRVNPDGNFWEREPNTHSVQRSSMPIPLNTWVHLECHYRWSDLPDGSVRCWQDGTLIFDAPEIVTQFSDWPFLDRPRQWTVNNYAQGSAPTTHVIYIDDAAIATSPQLP